MSEKNQVLLTKVNSVMKGDYIGVDELSEVVDLYGEILEEVEQENVTGEAPGLVGSALELFRPLLTAYDGYKIIPAEASHLSNDEITTLVNRLDKFKLGENAVRYQQSLYCLLVIVQTYFVFNGQIT